MIKRSYCFCFIVLNAGTYLDFALASIMSLVKLNPKSGIVIVEGADQFTHPLEKTKEGFSIDGTSEIIDKWVREYPDRIMYLKMGNVKDKRDLRNEMLDLARNFFDCQYIFGVDGDELVKVEDFLKIDQIIGNHPNQVSYWLKHYMFWGDFGKRCPDTYAKYKESIFYNAHNLKYTWWHTQVSLNDSPPLARFMPNAILKIDVPFYHYGYLCSGKRLLMKRLYSFSQIKWFSENVEQYPGYEGQKNLLEQGLLQGEPWSKEYWNTWEGVVEFALNEHPDEIKRHPWFGKSSQEIWDSNEVYPTWKRMK